MTSAEEDAGVLAVAGPLYALPPGDFTAARDQAARAADDKATAAAVKRLRKPSVAAWAVNLLVRREAEQIDQVLTLAASLRDAAAAMDGDELRALTRQRRQLTSALATSARALAREHEVRLSGEAVERVEEVLNAAMLDQVAADAVRTGLLVTTFRATGVGEVDLDGVLAVPSAVGTRAEPVERAAPSLHVVPDDDAVVRGRAEEALDRASAEREAAERVLAEADEEIARLDALQLQVQDELDQARRRVAELEEQAEDVESDHDAAEDARADALDQATAAREAEDRARERLAALG